MCSTSLGLSTVYQLRIPLSLFSLGKLLILSLIISSFDHHFLTPLLLVRSNVSSVNSQELYAYPTVVFPYCSYIILRLVNHTILQAP